MLILIIHEWKLAFFTIITLEEQLVFMMIEICCWLWNYVDFNNVWVKFCTFHYDNIGETTDFWDDCWNFLLYWNYFDFNNTWVKISISHYDNIGETTIFCDDCWNFLLFWNYVDFNNVWVKICIFHYDNIGETTGFCDDCWNLLLVMKLCWF